MEQEVYVTEAGLKQLKERLDFLKKVRRPEVSEKIGIARDYGDLSENAEYVAAKDEQGQVEGEIAELEEKVRLAKVINKKNIDTSKVSLGCSVKVLDTSFNEELEYKIVGSTESDPANGLLSNQSPAGKALLGGKVGDVVSYKSGAGMITMKILKIRA
ncbi:MAG: transcription elongation factor GreA [Firmicutes bacterium]|nr:transcription elongation factor GreA [Bacillota bacterium]